MDGCCDKGLIVKRDLDGGQMSRDMTLYVDEDGKAYHITLPKKTSHSKIAELSDDYLFTHRGIMCVWLRQDTMRHLLSYKKTEPTG